MTLTAIFSRLSGFRKNNSQVVPAYPNEDHGQTPTNDDQPGNPIK